ncbi:MAG TPA: HigA family addiction module antitoxin [Hyphomicrobium sp.]|nr:HigA family addiction module antitoxin [Hyphomicrobium sp.]
MTHNPLMKSAADLGDFGPLHPGEILREDMLPHYKVTAADLARAIGVAQANIDIVLAERAPVTQALAEHLGRSFGHSARYWMALQLQYDLWHGSLTASHQAR